ncbi:hypothetical protein PR202_ga17116 [Eleusine coracana subsp. coracana]|uniref:SCP domain-containing protein n=1 Tax=Eleusine coracana subsp. coracana TaxID=191504 RepID=A0AAV5CPQ9_ELECO|nr:hypothetical protein PR202_ga17116 [Eleusine coracana subsp. coracana]
MALAATVCAQNTAQDFVNLHNKARAAVGVGPVVWDPVVARYARNYAAWRARDCGLVLSKGPYGENLFWGSAGRVWTAADAVGLWVKQKANYDYNTDTCAVGKKCGSYKQVVWRESTRIGCSRVVCAANLGVFIICSYDPPGNFIGERPFAFASLP